MLSKEREKQIRRACTEFLHWKRDDMLRDCVAEIDRLRALCKRAGEVVYHQNPDFTQLAKELKAAGGE